MAAVPVLGQACQVTQQTLFAKLVLNSVIIVCEAEHM